VLDVVLRGVSFSYPHFALRDVSAEFLAGTHTAIIGPTACGASTLLRLIGGDLRPQSGEVILGTRVVNALRKDARPILFVTSALDAPERWSVEHLLVAAVRKRSLDRIDRRHELALAAEKWKLNALLPRSLRSLSSTERAQANLARIELLKPGVVIADRLLESVNPSLLPSVIDELYRTLRVLGATVITAPASSFELGFIDRVLVLDRGAVAQNGSATEVFASPNSEAAAIATGDINIIPIAINKGEAESPIGRWPSTAFEGDGIALVRPDDFSIPRAGEESDLIFGIEEANFADGRWHLRGFLTGGFILRVSLPRDTAIHKGRLIPLRYDPQRFVLLRTPFAAGRKDRRTEEYL
jgi:ABC-type sugar transport system ATPase subunit